MLAEFHAWADAEGVAQAGANRFLALLARRGREQPFGVALPGGRLATRFYEALQEAHLRSAIDWSEVHFFWADERCVPPTDAESNFGLAVPFFAVCKIPQGQIHRIHGEVEGGYAVEEAEAELCRLMPLTAEGMPILDLVLLGVGEDGHVASLFPQEPVELVNDRRIFRRVTATKPPPQRVTLGYQPIIRAREVWVLTSGEGKRGALRAITDSRSDLPIRRVISRREKTEILHDLSVPL